MSYKTQIEVVQNDFGYNLNMKIEDVDGSAVDLTGVGTVSFFAGLANSTAAKVSGTCTVTAATLGSVRYTVGTADFTLGDQNYQCEVEASWGTKVVTGRGLTVYVHKELAETV